MTELQIAVLAAVQGITEFLPISSSGHLVLVPLVTGWPDQGLVIDVAVHVGALGAVIVYFWRDAWSALRGLIGLLRGTSTADSRLALHLLIATAPIVGAGTAVIYFGLTDLWRNAEVIGWTMLGFGALLFVADRWGITVHRVEHMRAGTALFIGIAQMAALIPGTSRAGITMTAARMLGFERGESARFSMLLSIPAILAAGTVSGYGIVRAGNMSLGGDALLAAVLSLFAALLAIALLMFWLRRQSFTPFVIYRVVLGSALLYWVYF